MIKHVKNNILGIFIVKYIKISLSQINDNRYVK